MAVWTVCRSCDQWVHQGSYDKDRKTCSLCHTKDRPDKYDLSLKISTQLETVIKLLENKNEV